MRPRELGRRAELTVLAAGDLDRVDPPAGGELVGELLTDAPARAGDESGVAGLGHGELSESVGEMGVGWEGVTRVGVWRRGPRLARCGGAVGGRWVVTTSCEGRVAP